MYEIQAYPDSGSARSRTEITMTLMEAERAKRRLARQLAKTAPGAQIFGSVRHIAIMTFGDTDQDETRAEDTATSGDPFA